MLCQLRAVEYAVAPLFKSHHCHCELSFALLQLYTHREDVDTVNAQQLSALPAQVVKYIAQDSGSSMDLLQTACPVSTCRWNAALSHAILLLKCCLQVVSCHACTMTCCSA